LSDCDDAVSDIDKSVPVEFLRESLTRVLTNNPVKSSPDDFILVHFLLDFPCLTVRAVTIEQWFLGSLRVEFVNEGVLHTFINAESIDRIHDCKFPCLMTRTVIAGSSNGNGNGPVAMTR
jgi:hypothetical protein